MSHWQTWLDVFRTRKMMALLLLGFSSGLPLFLTSRTLQAWMTVEQVDLAAIGLFSLVSLPYSLKFLWSPLVDRYALPWLGRRRGWLVLTQVLLAVSIAAMGLQQPRLSLILLAVNALVVAFFSATQDIVFDAYRSDVLSPPELGAGAAVAVLGYRIALLATGSAALILADPKSPIHFTWPQVYGLLSLLMLLSIGFTFFAPEPKRDVKPPASLRAAVWLPFQDFVTRSGPSKAITILAFIVLYKFGDSLINNMVTPFLLTTGFDQRDIGAIQGGMGLVATIVGTLTGGALLSRWGVNRSLWVFGGLQAVSNFAYLILAGLGHNYPFMVLAINIENFCGGLGTAAFVAFLMSLCNPSFSATQFALLSSLMAVSRDLIVAPAGQLAKITGWPVFFILTIVFSLPGLALLPWFAPWRNDTATPESNP